MTVAVALAAGHHADLAEFLVDLSEVSASHRAETHAVRGLPNLFAVAHRGLEAFVRDDLRFRVFARAFIGVADPQSRGDLHLTIFDYARRKRHFGDANLL